MPAWPGTWISIADDPPPLGLQVLGLCDYTGVRSVTARMDDIKLRQWQHWHMNHPTHWRHLPPALALAEEPPAAPPICTIKIRGSHEL